MTNKIRTNKYTILSFLPLNLLDQFSKLANIYFLFIGLMQMIPSISISSGKPVIYMPLLVIVAITAIKDIFEDLKRYRQDQVENNKPVQIIDIFGQVLKKTWKDLLVGDIIKISNGEFFPADILVLQTSDKKGLCYIETKNLDGETALKRKQAPKELQASNINALKEEKYLKIDYEKPNPFIYNFQGTI